VAVFIVVGVPEITQVEGVRVSPSGRAPPAEIEQVVVAPLLVTIGVTEKAVPTVPITEMGAMLITGNPALTVIVTFAVLVPISFLMLIVYVPVPITVGVPEITQEEFMFNPAGRADTDLHSCMAEPLLSIVGGIVIASPILPDAGEYDNKGIPGTIVILRVAVEVNPPDSILKDRFSSPTLFNFGEIFTSILLGIDLSNGSPQFSCEVLTKLLEERTISVPQSTGESISL